MSAQTPPDNDLLGTSASEEAIAARLVRVDLGADTEACALSEFADEGGVGGAAGSSKLGTAQSGEPATGGGKQAPSTPGASAGGGYHLRRRWPKKKGRKGRAAEEEAEKKEGAAALAPPPSPADSDADVDIDAELAGAPFVCRVGSYTYRIDAGHVRGQTAPAVFFAGPRLLRLALAELHVAGGAFTAALTQLCNVGTLPGVVGPSLGMPDLHAGYGFAISTVAGFDAARFDINCGVRLLRTNIEASAVGPATLERLAAELEAAIPVGVGGGGALPLTRVELDAVLERGMEFTLERGASWPEDAGAVEERGRFAGARATAVSDRAKTRGLGQAGSLGSGNHYVEVQRVERVLDAAAAAVMGLREGQVVVMIHTGSRGLGHQVCTDALQECDRAMAAAGTRLVDRQLACVPLGTRAADAYLAAMRAAANFAFVNRAAVAAAARAAFARAFGKKDARALDMHVVYDVSHNIAKVEEHDVDGRRRTLLVHRKGATRAFPPGHPDVPPQYRAVGQPVLVGGSMGTASWVLVGTQAAMAASLGSTCHGAGRVLSRSRALKTLDSRDVLARLRGRGIVARVATRHLAAEEAPESYKDVDAVVAACEAAGLSRRVARLVPMAVVKG